MIHSMLRSMLPPSFTLALVLLAGPGAGCVDGDGTQGQTPTGGTPTITWSPAGETPTDIPQASNTDTQTPTASGSPSPSAFEGSPSPTAETPSDSPTVQTPTPIPTDTPPIDEDRDGFPLSEDCDDQDPDTYPGGIETCDGQDEDCDEAIDEGLIVIRSYEDQDGDGYGDPTSTLDACDRPEGWVPSPRDCDDGDASVYPDAAESCNEADDDCDGAADERLGGSFYLDADGDGWGLEEGSAQACEAPEGYVEQGGDCDDDQQSVHPGASEGCNDADDDCDGTVDEGTGQGSFADVDGDGYGDPATWAASCVLPEGNVLNGDDCDDARGDAYPQAPELCNDADDDCDGNTDEALFATWYNDSDGDGFGDPDTGTHTCAPPPGYIQTAGDCDDDDSGASPEGSEVCDARDNDCDGELDEGVGQTYYPDSDGDGYGDMDSPVQACSAPSQHTTNGQDCNDRDDDIKPGVIERCDDSVDQDCSGLVGGVDPSCEITGYAFAGAPDCGSSCYYDEAHNVAINGAGAEGNNNGYNRYALGQLTDGARGVDTYSADLGNGRSYEWVGWSSEDPQIYLRFGAERTIDRVTMGINNKNEGGVAMPTEIQVFLSHSYNSAPYDVVVFRSDLGTLPQIPEGKRGDIVLDLGGKSAAQIRIYCFRGAGWTFLDEIEVR